MLLKIENLKVKYGNVEALHGINFHVNEGEIVCILGANGAGKSTTLMALSGLVKASEGTITYNGEEINKSRAHHIVKSGIAQVPEGRRVFGTLTVHENLKLGAFTCDDKELSQKTLSWIYDLFPILKEREQQLAGTLSGGEQQMLAIGRALMAQPKVLLLDEPSLGLAPLVIKTIFETVKEINSKGVTIILVEQNAKAALKLSDRGYVMEVGRLTMEDDADKLLQNEGVQKAYLGG